MYGVMSRTLLWQISICRASALAMTAALSLIIGKIVIFGLLARFVGTRFVPWLLPDASFMSGALITVDGGTSAQ